MRLNIKSASMLLAGLVLATPVSVGVQQQQAIAQVQPLSDERKATVIQLLEAGLQLDQQKKYQAALEKYQQALKMVEGGRDRFLEGGTLAWIGLVYDNLGQYPQALDYYKKALVILKVVGDRSLEGATLGKVGSVYDSLSQYPKALDYYQQALVIHREVGDQTEESAILNNIGSAYSSLGQYPKALDYYQQALVIDQSVGERRGDGKTLNNMGSVYDSLGQYPKALDYYQQALAIRRKVGDRAGEGTILNNMGSVYSNLGQYPKALDYYQQALAIRQEVRDRVEEGTTLNNLGTVYNLLGQYEKALDYYQQALVINREVDNRVMESKTLNNLGSVYSDLGQYPKALDYYQQALVIHREVGDRNGEGAALNNLGLLYANLRQYPEALDYGQQALAIRKELGDRNGEGTTLNNLGGVYRRLGQSPKSLDHHQQALVISREIGDRSGEGVALSNIGFAYNELKQPVKALDYYQQALVIVREMSARAEERDIFNNIGTLLMQYGQLGESEKHFNKAISIHESLRLDLNDRNKISLTDSNRTPYELLQYVLIQQNKQNAALETSERGRGRALVELLASRLSDSSPEAIQKLSQPLALNQIKQVAQQHQATLVQYSKIGDNFYIWVIRPDGTIAFRQTPVKVDNVSIAKLTISARNLIGVRSRASIAKVQSIPDIAVIDPNTQTNTTAALKKLHQRLIDPIADLLPKNERDRVVFLPQGELFLVPFPALMDANGKTLIERHTILTAPSIATLKLTAEKRNAKNNTNQSALVVGNPTMPKMEGIALTALPGSEAEAKAIAPLLKTQALIGSAATKSAVMKQISQVGIIHLATHGLLDTIAGEVPGAIALAPDRPNQINDGFLTANEIFDLKLNAHLAVLSACSTGKGDITGDGVIGLSRSLIAAGVPSIVVSLWDVDDQSTSFLMQEFYRNLQTTDKAQALRQAMLTTMRQKNYQSPYHWAAFTLIGEAE
jgi:CHAT domain-containing protein/Tfp pilus assembly protein PilF